MIRECSFAYSQIVSSLAWVRPKEATCSTASKRVCKRLTRRREIFSSSRILTPRYPSGGVRGPQGLPLFKPPYARITAIDLNTGETLWWIPNGDTPDRIANHPALEGVDIGNTGSPSHPTTISTKSLLIYGEGRGGRAVLHAHNKRTGERIGTVEIPAPTNTAPMTFMHEGVQYIVVPVGGSGAGRGGRGGRRQQHPGSFVALRLPE